MDPIFRLLLLCSFILTIFGYVADFLTIGSRVVDVRPIDRFSFGNCETPYSQTPPWLSRAVSGYSKDVWTLWRASCFI